MTRRELAMASHRPVAARRRAAVTCRAPTGVPGRMVAPCCAGRETSRDRCRRRWAGRWRDPEGTASLVLPITLWVAIVASIALLDVGAYLVAASRAQALADAAALAAVGADAGGSPRTEARRVADAGHGGLERCDCAAGTGRATVEVSVEVAGLVIPRLGATRVTATASAALVPP